MTETIKITDITPARYNPRKISEEEYKKLSNSINEFGLVDPIIINLNNNHIIGGHQRFDVIFSEYMDGNEDYEELQLIRRGEIGWIFPNDDLKVKDLNHEKALNIVLNKVQGEFDSIKLGDLLNDLSIEGLDLEITGFGKEEIKDLFSDVDVSGFGEGLEDNYISDEEPKKEVRNSRTIKEITCPSCGHVFLEDEVIDDDL